jgi:hypothetical protein
MLHLDPLARIQCGQERFKILAELVVRCWGVGGLQPVVAAQEQFITTKLEPSMQHRVRFETLACGQSTVPDGAEPVCHTLDGAPAGMGLTPAAVQESKPPLGQVHGIVRVVGHQHDPWPLRDVAVIRHVDEEFLELLGLNPVVKDGDELLQLHTRGIIKKKF